MLTLTGGSISIKGGCERKICRTTPSSIAKSNNAFAFYSKEEIKNKLKFHLNKIEDLFKLNK